MHRWWNAPSRGDAPSWQRKHEESASTVLRRILSQKSTRYMKQLPVSARHSNRTNAGRRLMVEFLETLRYLPRHEIYSFSSRDPERRFPRSFCSRFGSVELGHSNANYQVYPHSFSFLFPKIKLTLNLLACYPPYRWRNINSAMACLTTSGLFNSSWLSSLFDVLPSIREYPDLEKCPIDRPNKLGNYIFGAAQWVTRFDECCYVY